jgi:hypothetical protein
MRQNPGIKDIWMALFLLVLITGSCGRSKEASPQHISEEGFRYIFDGETLNGWEGDPDYWRVEDSSLVGEIVPETVLQSNTFIIWQGGKPGDFELKLEYRISEDGNSGINYRSVRIDSLPYAVSGYQADIDGRNRYTGQNYEERKRTTLAYRGQKVVVHSQPDSLRSSPISANVSRNAWGSMEVVGSLGDPDSLGNYIRSNDWNECHLVVQGNRMRHYINGVLMSDITDNDTLNRTFEGLIGVQVHVGPPMEVAFRNIRLKELQGD